MNGPSSYENVVLACLPRPEWFSSFLLSKEENPFWPRKRCENTPFSNLSQQKIPPPATTELTGGGSASSHSSLSHMGSQKGLTPSARGTMHLVATEMAGPGVAREEMPGMAGGTAEKDAPFQVRKRSFIINLKCSSSIFLNRIYRNLQQHN